MTSDQSRWLFGDPFQDRKKTKKPLDLFRASVYCPALTCVRAGENEPIAPEVAEVLCPPGTRCFRVFFWARVMARRVRDSRTDRSGML
jgi:hypothetical protein